MECLLEAGRLSMVPEDHAVVPGVRVLHTPGHTPGHRSVVLTDGDATLLVAGDLLHLPIQVAHPDWASGHDEDPALGCASRETLLLRARAERWNVAVPHFAQVFGSVGPSGWEPAEV